MSTSAADRGRPAARAAADPVVRDLLALLPTVTDETRRPVVVDVGGGSGTRSVPLAVAGCRVTVIDPSVDALAILRRRATEAGVADRVTGLQGDLEALPGAVPAQSADLVLCHRVLESADDDHAAVAALAAVLRPGGVLSLLVAGRHAATLALASAGRPAQALQLHRSASGCHGASDPVQRRYDVASAQQLLATAGLQLEQVRGIGVVGRWVPAAPDDDSDGSGRSGGGDSADASDVPGGDAAGRRWDDLEDELGRCAPLQDLAPEHHLVARRPAPGTADPAAPDPA